MLFGADSQSVTCRHECRRLRPMTPPPRCCAWHGTPWATCSALALQTTTSGSGVEAVPETPGGSRRTSGSASQLHLKASTLNSDPATINLDFVYPFPCSLFGFLQNGLFGKQKAHSTKSQQPVVNRKDMRTLAVPLDSTVCKHCHIWFSKQVK